MSAIALENVSHAFLGADGRDAPVLTGINLAVEPGELVAIVGPSGCGKTTVLNMVAGLDDPQEGLVSISGERPSVGDPKVSYVLARDSLLPWRTVLQNAMLGLEVHGVPRAEREERARSALASVGLAGYENHYGAQLSHGMRQRVALARAFAMAPQFLLMDEPFSALDAQTRLAVHDEFMQAWSRYRMTVVLITHDLTEAVGLADRVIIMTKRPGRIKAIHKIDLPRPRSMAELQSDSRFHEIYERVWEDLKDEFIESGPSKRHPTH